jgi:peptidyl-prolyl cis-trans isomerase D
MSVIQSIRDRGAWIMLVLIALALIAFILQDSMNSRGGGGGFSSSSTVGTVNGKKIKKEDFDAKVEDYVARSGQSRENAIPQIWNNEVQTLVMKEEFDKLGLTVSTKELSEFLYGPQSPLARSQNFMNEAGQLDFAKVQQYFNEAKKGKDAALAQEVLMLTEQSTLQILYAKYQGMLQQSSYVPTWLIEKQKAESAEISSISYVYVPYNTIVDSTIKVSDDEIMGYVKKHEKQFKKEEETRTFSYVVFDASPSKDDSSATLDKIKILKDDFTAARDTKAYLAKTGSELPYSEAYILKSQMKMPYADTIKALAVGQTFGPYLDMNNYVIAKMVGSKAMPDSVFCMHILIADNGDAAHDSLGKKRIDSVEAVIKAGSDFKTVMEKVSDNKDAAKDQGGVMKFSLAQIQDAQNFDQDFAKFILYEGKTGEKKVVHTKYGWHYIYIVNQTNIQPAVNVAYLAKPINVSSTTASAANTAALQFAADAKDKAKFEETAKKLNKDIIPSQDIKVEDFSLPMFGQASSSRSIVRWLFENDLGKVGEPTDVGSKYIVPIITGISKKGLPTAAAARKQVEQLVRNEKKAKQIIESKFKGSTLEQYATSAGVQVQKLDSLSFTSQVLPGLGYEPKFLGAAFNKELQGGKLSSVIAGNQGVAALSINGNIGTKATVADNEMIKQSLLGPIKGIGNGSMGALRKAAKVENNMLKMY